jgi:hypothetical protein
MVIPLMFDVVDHFLKGSFAEADDSHNRFATVVSLASHDG